jgi:hypothetical protein
MGGDLQQGDAGLGQVLGGCEDDLHVHGQLDAPLRDAGVRGSVPKQITHFGSSSGSLSMSIFKKIIHNSIWPQNFW